MCDNMTKCKLFCCIFGLVLMFQCVYTASNVGCLFRPDLCNPEEECFDDNAFGRCQFTYDPDLETYRHSLASGDLKLLEREFSRLFAGGYRWRHEYTQCVVQNILYTSRHKISYDPGLCARVMHLTLPEVPPDVLAEIESPEPDELAFIKYKPNRNDPKENMYAEEVYNPLDIEIKEEPEVKEAKKRSTDSVDDRYLNKDWLKSLYDDLRKDKDKKIETTDTTSLFRKLLELADDTGKLFDQYQNGDERYPDDNVPLTEKNLSSDLNFQPAHIKDGTQLIPIDEDFDYVMGNDIIDTDSKKRMWEPNELPESNEITPFRKGKYDNFIFTNGNDDDEKHFGKSKYNGNTITLNAKDKGDNNFFVNRKYDDNLITLKAKYKDGTKFFKHGKYDDNLITLKANDEDDNKLVGNGKYDDHLITFKANDDNKFLGNGKFDGNIITLKAKDNDDDIFIGNDEYDDDLVKIGERKYDDDIVQLTNHNKFGKKPGRNDVDDLREESTRYKNSPMDDEDKNFKWNDKHINKGVDNDLTKFARESKNGNRKTLEPDNKNLKDVIEDDYLEDQLYAILPVDNGMSTFTRKRYDIKKPGPTYMYHDDEDGDTTNDNMAHYGPKSFISRLAKSSQQQQILDLLTPPVAAQKSSTIFVPSREVFDARQRITVVTGVSQIPLEKEADRASQRAEPKPFERLSADQPELLEGVDNLAGKDIKDEERMANAAQTGEGQIGNRFEAVDGTRAYITIKEEGKTDDDARNLVEALQKLLNLPKGSFSDVRIKGTEITFKVNPNNQNLTAAAVAAKAEEKSSQLQSMTNMNVEVAGIGDKVKYEVIDPNKDRRLFILAFALCGGVAGILLAAVGAYLFRKHARSREKLQNVTHPDIEPSQDYQDLCRQRMAAKSNDKPENIHNAVHSPKKIRSLSQEGQVSSSSHSSTSSWNEEPVTSNMDITTGHIILAYMEDHLKNKDRLDREWEGLCAYEAELCSTTAAVLTQNIKKNRYTDVLPYNHSRVLLTEVSNVASSDYINASSITDHDPRNPAYIATQGPLPQTAADFWQMIWEQGSVVIVMLSRLMENGVAMCHRYWPEEGSEVYHIYEVHLVSEHIWCDDYLVRSFYLKNLRTNETRTVTQFHFMSWPDNGVPNSTKALLEFRRKVNKSYRGRSCPIVVHCSDGIGRTGTYCLIDMVLNRMAKGAKEIDIAATLEHVRDQRAGMVKTKAQFEFVLMAIAEEVHAILKALSQ